MAKNKGKDSEKVYICTRINNSSDMYHVNLFCKSLTLLFVLLLAQPSQGTALISEGDTVLLPLGGVFTEVFDRDIAAKKSASASLSEKTYQVEGYLVEAKGGAFKEVLLRDERGKPLKMVWTPNGRGRNAGQALLEPGRTPTKLLVTYKPMDCYLPKQGRYITMLKITGVQIAP